MPTPQLQSKIICIDHAAAATLKLSRCTTCLLLLSLSACVTVSAPEYVACARVDSSCEVSDATDLSVDILRKHGDQIEVQCTREVNVAIDDDFRADCRAKIDKLAIALSSRLAGQLRHIDTTAIGYKDTLSFLTLNTGVCLELHGVEATIPLAWASP